MGAYHWLLWLTILYVAVLVIVLASGLIAIARALIITKRSLAKIDAGLAQVQIQTQPLANSLEAINAVLIQTAGGLSALVERLKGADAHLGRIADKLVARR